MSHATPSDTMRAYAQATLAADTAAITAIATDGFVYTHSSALRESRQQLVDAFTGGRRYTGWEIQELSEQSYPGCTIVTGAAALGVKRADGPGILNIKFTATMVPAATGGWQIAALHSTKIPD
jgi:ketosteroid isomerase-like protein